MSDSDRIILASDTTLSVLIRRIFRFFYLAYVPLGPSISCENPRARGEILSSVASALRPFLPPKTIFLRFDPPWTCADGSYASKRESIVTPSHDTVVRTRGMPQSALISILKAPIDVQPPDTVIVSLKPSPDVMLDSMKPKWRYNVRLAEKKGVTIRRYDGSAALDGALDDFYRLYLETAKRDGIAIHARSYYSRLLETSGAQRVSVYVAENNNVAIASIITLCYGREATYLYGASSNEGRNLMPTYLLQWKAMLDAREFGCVSYDLYGIPPDDNPSHPMHGLYRFKTGFGGAIVHRVGSHDAKLLPLAYSAYALAERARALWFKKIVKCITRGIRRTSST